MNNLLLHHVGIIQPNEKTAMDFARLFSLEEEYRGYVPEYNALCIFLKSSNGSTIEFVIPDGGKLKDFNNGKGGIHHVAFLVDDVEKAQKELEEKGVGLLENIPVKGAGDIYVNFVRPRFSQGILVELVQNGKAGVSEH